MRNLLLTALICSSFFLGACSSTQEKKLSKKEKAMLYVDIANASFMEGDFIGSLGSLKKAEELDANLPEIHHAKALSYYFKKDLNAALQSAQRAVALAPEFSDAQTTLGKIYLDLKKFNQAEKHLMIAAADPLYRDAYKARTNLGVLYFEQGQYTLAKKQLDSAIQIEPMGACVAYYYRGQILDKQEKHSDAIKDYTKATRQLCGNYGDAHYAIGVSYAKSKKYKEARKKFVEITELYPETDVAQKAYQQLRYIP